MYEVMSGLSIELVGCWKMSDCTELMVMMVMIMVMIEACGFTKVEPDDYLNPLKEWGQQGSP